VHGEPRVEGKSMKDTSDGGLRVSVNVRIPVAEMARWSPERIRRFFQGVAKVVAARDDAVEAEKKPS
jgi:hypothetical protein